MKIHNMNYTLSGRLLRPGGNNSSSAGTLGAGARTLGMEGGGRRCVPGGGV